MGKERKVKAFQRWQVLMTTTLIQSIICGLLESYGALLVPMMKELEKSNEAHVTVKSALIGSLASGCLMGFSPLASYLSDKIGAVLVAVIGGIVVFFATFSASFASTFITLSISYGFFLGLGSSLLFITNGIIISQQFPDNNVVAFSMLGFGNGVANAILPHIMVYAVSNIDIHGAIRTLCLLVTPIMFLPFFWTEIYDEPIVSQKDRSDVFSEDLPRPTELMKREFIPDLYKKEIKDQGKILNVQLESRIYMDAKAANNYNKYLKRLAKNSRLIETNLKIKNFHSHNMFLEESYSHDMIKSSNESNRNDSISLAFLDDRDSEEEFKPLADIMKEHMHDDFDYDFLDISEEKRTVNLKFNLTNYSSVLKVKGFLYLCFSMDLASMGYQVPNVHIVNYSNKLNNPGNAQLLLTCLGGASAVGPLINPFFIEKFENVISKFRIFQMFVLGYGIAVIFLSLVSNYSLLMVICSLIGYFDGSFSSLIGPIAIDFVGNAKAPLALGIYYGSIALPVTIAAPLAGFIYEKNQNYIYSFYVSGIFFLIGGFLLSFTQTNIESGQKIST